MRLPLMAAFLLLSTAPVTFAPVQAQSNLEGRVGKIEKELKAVQRKVFPGGDNRFFEAEITPPDLQGPAAGIPATTPLSDLTARVNALESSLQQVTGQVEQNTFKMRQLEEQMARMKAETDMRMNQMQGGATDPSAALSGTPSTASAASSVATPPPVVTSSPASAEKPSDPGEADYMAGYRLWTEKKYPEAQAALRAVVAKYPNHKRASYAQNLLGRAFLDEGKPALAAEAFYANYQKMPRGERAPDSLYYLGQALIQLKKPQDACRVFGELQDVYGASMSASLKDRVGKARADAKCS
ncbi:MAG: tol-pal system YbgF family protein [Sphingomonadaceae bacterium]